MKTTVAGGRPMNLAPVVIDEITVLGSRCGPFAEAITALAGRQVDVTGLISRRIKPEAAESLFGDGIGPGVMKVVIGFDR
jgi:threonine dehydrogenase-like Zn-dependent dehydrogenase